VIFSFQYSRGPHRNHGATGPFVRGFSLIELMTVLVVLAIIIGLAYPMYAEQVRKARRADATASLADRAQLLERCFTRYSAYNDASCPNPVGVSDEGFYTVTAARTATTFTLTATPLNDQVNDPCGAFTVDHLGNKTPTPSADRCWGSAGGI